jgi:nicotinamidase-related amidase
MAANSIGLTRALRPYELPLPGKDIYDPQRVGEFFAPDYGKIMKGAAEFRKDHKIKPRRLVPKHLLVGHTKIDLQGTFILEMFKSELSIGPEAVEDTCRDIEFDIRNRRIITDDEFTLDTHPSPYQIFHPLFFVNADGSPLDNAIAQIASADVGGKYIVNPEMCGVLWPDAADPMIYYPWLRWYAKDGYCAELEKQGKPKLVNWRMHGRLGHPGHSLVPSVAAVADFCDLLRWSKSIYREKGDRDLVEHYSPFGTEVVTVNFGGKVLTVGEVSDQIIADLLKFRILFLSGQALSHCVRAALIDIIRYLNKQDKTLARRIYLLKDCTSSVPGFEKEGQDALDQAQDAGIHLVESTQPLDEMEDFPQEIIDFACAT